MKMISLRCHEMQGRLPAYARREISAAARQDIARHIESCPDCYRAYASLRAETRSVAQPLRQFGQPDNATIKRLWTNIQAELAAPIPARLLPPAQQPVYRAGLIAAFLMALLVLPFSLGRAYSGTYVPTQPKPHTVVLATPEADIHPVLQNPAAVASASLVGVNPPFNRPNLNNTPAPPQ